MHNIRLSGIILWLVMAIFGCVSLAIADLYTYRDAQGRLHLTNDPSTIPVAYRMQANATRRKKAGPMTVSTVPSAMTVGHSSPTPTVQPIDTARFALLRLGMRASEVAQRLGEPALKIAQRDKETLKRAQSVGIVKRLIRFETWYYPGTEQLLPTRLIFHDGLLAHKFQ